jgi:hypothetical protein
MRALAGLVVAASSLALLAGCPMPESAAAHMQNVASDFNTNIRFGRLSLAVEDVSPKEREEFLRRTKALGERIQIADYELISAKMDDNEHAHVIVKYDWYDVTMGDLHSTQILQKWVNEKGGWKLTHEERDSGAEGILGETPLPAEHAEPQNVKSAQFPTVRLGD